MFRLCLALGGMTVSELRARMTSRELSEWMAFYETHPFGVENGYIQSATIIANLVSLLADKKGRSIKVSDFFPSFMRPEASTQKMPVDKLKEVLTGMATIKIKRKKKNG